MKVLHLLYSDSFSGAENVVCQIIGMMKDEPDLEMVYCSSEGPIRDALNERNIRFVLLNNFSIGKIKQVIKKEKPDIIHAHDMRASFYASMACGKIPLVSHIHNNAFDSRGISLKSIAYIRAAIKAKHIFWVSQSSFEGYRFQKWFAEKSTILYNIINMDDLYEKMNLDKREYNYDVIYVGRLTFQKNPQRMMKIFGLLKEKKSDIKIGVIGTGDLEKEIKEYARECGLLNNVEFLGFQSNPLKILHDSKVMIMTSRWEGTPICALEAMALGVPIVSTPTDGIKDLVETEKNGFLSDEDEVLCEKILELIVNYKKRTELSKNAKEFSVRYNDIVEYRTDILKVYKS